MARKERTVYDITDDLTGEAVDEKDAQEIFFSYAGTDYKIDLGKANAKKLDDFLAPYIDAATRVAGRTAAKSGGKTEPSKEERNAMRTWAQANGYTVSDRGRISQEIQKAYRDANNS
ncbi:histone-like nucleoid-structuring protein Lsr2 [Microbacterium testaceum]|uniref:histone-like nucleoid-structuring protein Lsr2 n=1 Tax=Microbacterium testaceum TaxID=2033 RepID=UPI001A9C3881|nr:Lsr2 family protein [Microbacterium testaceum]